MNKHFEILKEIFEDDGNFPNSPLAVLIYKDALSLKNNGSESASEMEKLFQKNNWGSSWRNGIYNFHHYHSTAHEVLGIYSGRASVRLGGPKGNTYEVTKGDVIIIPAGVAHKNIDQSSDFKCVGAYPAGQIWDMNYGKKNERPEADKNIKKVPLPEQDPVLGADEGLINYWK